MVNIEAFKKKYGDKEVKLIKYNMNAIEIIYIIGGICSVIIAAHIILYDFIGDDDVTVNDLGLLILMSLVSFIFSWISATVWLFCIYGEKVVIKRKKRR